MSKKTTGLAGLEGFALVSVISSRLSRPTGIATTRITDIDMNSSKAGVV